MKQLLILALINVLILSCQTYKSIDGCSNSKEEFQLNIKFQIDSVYNNENDQFCGKLKKIISCEDVYDPRDTSNAKFVVMTLNNCKLNDYFYFNEKNKLVEVMHELSPVY